MRLSAKIYGPLNRREQEVLALLAQHNVTPAADIMPKYGMAVMNLWRHGMVTYCAGALALSGEGQKLMGEVPKMDELTRVFKMGAVTGQLDVLLAMDWPDLPPKMHDFLKAAIADRQDYLRRLFEGADPTIQGFYTAQLYLMHQQDQKRHEEAHDDPHAH